MFTLRYFSHVLVRNIESHVSKELALEVFSFVGEVKDIAIDYNKETESNSGVLLVQYKSSSDCQKAFEMFNEKKVLGKVVKIEILQEDEKGAKLNWETFKPRTEYKTRPKLYSTSIEF